MQLFLFSRLRERERERQRAMLFFISYCQWREGGKVLFCFFCTSTCPPYIFFFFFFFFFFFLSCDCVRQQQHCRQPRQQTKETKGMETSLTCTREFFIHSFTSPSSSDTASFPLALFPFSIIIIIIIMYSSGKLCSILSLGWHSWVGTVRSVQRGQYSQVRL